MYLYIPGASLGGLKASLWIAVSATNRFVMCTTGIIHVLVISTRLRIPLTNYCAGGLAPPEQILQTVSETGNSVCW